MTWLRRVSILLLSVTLVLLLAVAVAFFYTLHFIATEPVDGPSVALLSQPASPVSDSTASPPWLLQALTDQRQAPDLADFRNPPRHFGPWTRWWWPGNLVEVAELRREMRVFADVGIAGVEIQPFAISVSESDKARERWQSAGWDSPAFYQNLHTVLETALDLDMQVDLNNGSGWPTGGPHVALQDGMRQLVHSEQRITGPTQLDVPLEAPAMPIGAFFAGAVGMLGETPMQTFVADTRELVSVVAAEIVEDRRTWAPWDLQDQVKLDASTRVDITAYVKEGKLQWEVPPGRWAITTLWQMPGGELVSGGYAHPEPGYVVDHLDAARMRANQDYLFRAETGLAQYYGRPLRAFFNDSLEFRQERHWARGHLEEFERRMGYDPRPWMAALVEPGKDQMPFHALNINTRPAYDLGPQAQRFLEDWDSVVSDLFRERYLRTMEDWASERTLAHRIQAYGGPIDIIRAAGESDIPETEQLYAGGSEMFLKAVASGAQIAGKPVVSAESFIFMGRAFMTTPLKIKALADKALVAGINQIIFHGTSYAIEDHEARGYPVDDGWYPWQLGNISTDYSENWPFWRYAGQLNRYIARNQYLLRKGRAEVDVIVLYPGIGFPQGYFNAQEPLDRGLFPSEEVGSENADAVSDGRGADRMRELWEVTRALEKRGLTWAWTNEHALAGAQYHGGVLKVGELNASGLRLHAIEALNPDVAEHITVLAEAGMPVEISGGAPQRQRGLADHERGDARVRAAMAKLSQRSELASPPVQFSHGALKSLRRRLAGGDVLQFFSNPTAEWVEFEAQPESGFEHALWLDAWTGSSQRLDLSASGNKIRYALPPYGSIHLWLQRLGGGPSDSTVSVVTDRIPVTHWSLAVPDQDFSIESAALGDWLDNAQLRDSGGPGLYEAQFVLSAEQVEAAGQGAGIAVELGKLHGAADITLNGQAMGSALVPPFRVALTDVLQVGENRLEVLVTVPRKNRLISEMLGGAQGWNAPELVKIDTRVSAGLVGPVSLVLLQEKAYE